MDQLLRSADWRFDVLHVNPPFGRDHLPPETSLPRELAFLEMSMTLLNPRGRCGIVVPDGILFRDERPFRRIRERLLTEFAVIGIVRLLVGTFASAPNVRTNLLIFERGVIQPDLIRYYQIQAADRVPLGSVPCAAAMERALAWIRDGVPDRYSWDVRVEDVKCGDWSLDIPWPDERHDHNHRRGQLPLPTNQADPIAAQAFPLANLIERRGAKAGSRTVDRLLGISKHGISPFKGKPASDISRYRRVECRDFAYNPMRVASGAIALCQDPQEEGWVSPAYVVFKLKDGAPFSSEHLLNFLRTPSGMAEAERHSHGSVCRRLRYKDLGRILVPMRLNQMQADDPPT
jgi:type I restriction enzyme M protein